MGKSTTFIARFTIAFNSPVRSSRTFQFIRPSLNARCVCVCGIMFYRNLLRLMAATVADALRAKFAARTNGKKLSKKKKRPSQEIRALCRMKKKKMTENKKTGRARVHTRVRIRSSVYVHNAWTRPNKNIFSNVSVEWFFLTLKTGGKK